MPAFLYHADLRPGLGCPANDSDSAMTPANQLQLFDVDLVVNGCEGLPRMDYVGHADPYFILQVVTPDGRQAVRYRSAVVYNTGNPSWDEEVSLRNVPVGTLCTFKIRDKDHLTADDDVGTCRLVLDAGAVSAAAACPRRASASDIPPGAPAASAPVSGPASGSASGPASGRAAAAAAASSGAGQGGALGTARSGLARTSTGSCAEGAASAASSEGGTARTVRLPIQPAPGVPVSAGCLVVALRCRPASGPAGPMMHVGPVRYRMSASPLAGALTRHVRDDGLLAFAAYKLSLSAVPHFFPAGASLHWNTEYENARKVFTSSAVVAAVRAQHSMLYADSATQRSRGLLHGGGDLVALLRGGVRARQRRYFTYAITEEGSLCFSETGATFFSDFMSKHAMHSGCADRVVYAGEFCLLPPGLHSDVTLLPSPGPGLNSRTSQSPDPTAATRLVRSARLQLRDSPPPALPGALPLQAHSLPPRPHPLSQSPPAQRAKTCLMQSPHGHPPLESSQPPAQRSQSQPQPPAKLTAAEAAAEADEALSALVGVSGCDARGWWLVADNNSGTYAPPASQLPALAALLRHNFPGLGVEVVDVTDPRLAVYHARVPSRVR